MDETLVYNGIINQPMVMSQSSETFKHFTDLGLSSLETFTACQATFEGTSPGHFTCTRSPHPGDPMHIACGSRGLAAFWLEQK